MKLYFATGACSLSPHIVLRELGLPFELVRVNLKTKRTSAGEDFTAINAKGYVPVLDLDDGQRLTEGLVIVQYLADRVPEAELLPRGGLARYRCQEWLAFIASELHKHASLLFETGMPEAARAIIGDKLTQRIAWVAGQLDGRTHLLGERFSVADAYLFVILEWAPYLKIDLTRWPALEEFVARVASRPSVGAALEAESLAP